MLRTRVLTAAILIPLFVLAVLKLPAVYFSILLGIVVLLGAWEWAHLAGYSDSGQRIAFTAAAGVLMAGAHVFRDPLAEPLLAAASIAWIAVAVLLWRRRDTGVLDWPGPARWAAGYMALLPAWLGVCLLQETAPGAVLLLFVFIWVADSAAYFTGRRLGRRKLAAAISPGKTLEGLWGALISVLPVVALYSVLVGARPAWWAALTALGIVVVLMSVVGDLFESNWKRLGGIKDSGGLLPGHGGVLDRVDSMTAAAPFFVLAWLWWFGSAST